MAAIADGVRPEFDHRAAFSGTDEGLVSAATAFLAEGLDHDGIVVVVATAAHCRAFHSALTARGLTVDVLSSAGRNRAFDASDLLDHIVSDGTIDHEEFRSIIGDIIDDVQGDGVPVRVFGEMVASLWAEGRIAAAIDLEAQWNALSASRDFSLYCGYAMSSIAAARNLLAVKQVCDLHSDVIPPDDAPAESGDGEGAGESQYDRMFVGTPAAIRQARTFVGGTVRRWGLESVADDAVLVTSELATNALRHARSPFQVAVARRGASIRIAVRDASPGGPDHVPSSVDSAGGRGLALVAALSRAWGTDEESDGKTVWAELDC